LRPRISVITLGVADRERAVRFYRDGLGLPLMDNKPPVDYFELEGTWLALYPRDSLARFAGVDGHGEGFRAVTLSCNVASREEVDDALACAQAAGASIVKEARAFSWGGYAGWFADPDGHLWEVVWNPRPFLP
jgi:catechol 2,3-dioxygenase-like lactoylglutathione lyase family enzyme